MSKPEPKVAGTNLTATECAALDAAYWADFYGIQLMSGKFSFLPDHLYQIEPMQSYIRRVCYIKGTQGGWTQIEVLKTLHGLIYKRYPQGVLYMFPTTDDVQEFSKSRFNPLISSNREVIGQFVKADRKSADTTSLKKIHDAFLYLRGARLTQSVGSANTERESSKLRGIPVDRAVFDEVDLMDEDVIAKAKGRMGHSKIKEEVYISNPTIPDYGIDKIFQRSDQRHLFRKCDCGHWTCAELSFPGCVKLRKDGSGYIGCDKCGKPVGICDIGKIEWVPSKKDNIAYMRGYRWSQLSSTLNDPAEILEEFNDPPQGNIGDVYRLRLGLPYIAAEDKLTPDIVQECCTNDVMLTYYSEGAAAMGVDVGKIKHIVIGIRSGKDRYEILKVAALSSWNDIHDLAKRFSVKSAVIDIRPYEDEARTFQKTEPYRIWLCEYSEHMVIGANYSDTTGVMKVNRTEIFDSSHRLISEKRLRLPRLCPEMDEFVKQCCSSAKVLETNKKTQSAVYRYRKVGPDHYRNSLNYFYLAASGSKIPISGGSASNQPAFAIHTPVRLQKNFY